ncbi:hypothetical protein NLJ89_g11285 [Agrocybe chaxingu]|uniref:Aminoglycoside phosphotransferase domain-containing protein n=1 Tax=Agrocybe chaxingu TaxID=84603 RepID=A0A9W8JQ99_9AGAR|nr:hypothetical protein NLJ89_g11285 [Agrocybe chaxingu]
MDFVRWFFALPDPTVDLSGLHISEQLVQRSLRRQRSPFWRAVNSARATLTLWYYALEGLWASFWHGANAIISVFYEIPLFWFFALLASLGRWVYVKYTHGRGEAATMQFAASRTSIPLPRVWFSFRHPLRRDCEVILMSRHTGTVLSDAWPRLSGEKKDIITDQLRGFISQLRSLPVPDGQTDICSVTGGPIRCFRLHADGTTGPFRDEAHMNQQLRHLHPLSDSRFPDIVRRAHSRKHPLVFTHNDFFPRNILINEDSGMVVAVLDWESAGWFPSHWEYCKCINWGTWNMEEEEWRTTYVPMMVPIFEEEAEADRALMYECDLGIYLSPYVHA